MSGFCQSVGQRLGVAESHQQRAGKTGAFGHSQSIDAVVGLVRVFQSFADDGHDRSQMFTRCQFRHHSAVGLMSRNLRIHDVGDDLFARANDSRRRLVAGALNAEDENIGHKNIVRCKARLRWKATATVEGHGFSRAEELHFEKGFSPGSPRLKPHFHAPDLAGLKPGASTEPEAARFENWRTSRRMARVEKARPPSRGASALSSSSG